MKTRVWLNVIMLLMAAGCSRALNESGALPSATVNGSSSSGQSVQQTQTGINPEAVTVGGTVADASPSAGVITLMESADGFEVIAVTAETSLTDFNGNALRMNQVQPGMFVKADGTAGQGGALIASHVIIFSTRDMRAPAPPVLLTYLGSDGNVWVYRDQESEPVQVTIEAAESPSSPSIVFMSPRLSSDGTLVAVERQERSISTEMMTINTSLLVYEVSSRSVTEIYDQDPAGFDWKPGSHLLAYVPKLDEAYFRSRGQVDSEYANSILGYDHDTGVMSELVNPQGGYALAKPAWSPSGRFLSFEEVQGYEGSGWFAYFDFESDRYASWGRAIGNYDWSPDEESIIYDELTYTGNGTEMIWLSDRAGVDPRQLSPDLDWGVVGQPAFSPGGNFVSYLYYRVESDRGSANVYIQQVDGSEPIDLGAFDFVSELDWVQDDQTLLIEAAGPSGQQEVQLFSINLSEIRRIAIGTDPCLAPSELPGESLSDQKAAEKALRSYFESLGAGQYAAAVDLYGGPYSIMREHNPTINREDLAGLFRAACEINGAQCLAPASIKPIDQVDLPEGEFLFSVQFLNSDGTIFSLGPCCGDDSGDQEAHSEFRFRVRKLSEYRYVVLDPPVYMP